LLTSTFGTLPILPVAVVVLPPLVVEITTVTS
jgi:hypothetical protein